MGHLGVIRQSSGRRNHRLFVFSFFSSWFFSFQSNSMLFLMKVFHLLLWDSYSSWFTWSWESLYCSQTCSLLIKSAIKSGSGSLRKFGTMHFSTIFKAVFRLILCPWNWDSRVTGCPILKKNSINLDRKKKSLICEGSGSLRKFSTIHFSTNLQSCFRLILWPWNWDPYQELQGKYSFFNKRQKFEL